MKRAFVLGFYDGVASKLDPDLRAEVEANVIWFGKNSAYQPFEIGKFRSRVQADLTNLPPEDCFFLLANLTSEQYVLEIVREIVGAQRSEQILVTNNLEDAVWLTARLRNLGFPQKRDPLNLDLLNQYFGGPPWRCLCVRPRFQTPYIDALNRANFPQDCLQGFVDCIEEHTANAVQRVIRVTEAYSGLLYAHKGLHYLPSSAREQFKNKRFHEDTTTARVIDKLRLAIIGHSGTRS